MMTNLFVTLTAIIAALAALMTVYIIISAKLC